MSSYYEEIIAEIAEMEKEKLKGARLFDVTVDVNNVNHLLALISMMRSQLESKSDTLERMFRLR